MKKEHVIEILKTEGFGWSRKSYRRAVLAATEMLEEQIRVFAELERENERLKKAIETASRLTGKDIESALDLPVEAEASNWGMYEPVFDVPSVHRARALQQAAAAYQSARQATAIDPLVQQHEELVKAYSGKLDEAFAKYAAGLPDVTKR